MVNKHTVIPDGQVKPGVSLDHWKWAGEYIATNHTDRITRAIEADRKLEGTISLDDLPYKKWGYEVIPFKEPINLNGIMYCHYFTTGEIGRPVTSARALTIKKHQSCVMGHNPATEIDMSQVRADGTPLISIFAGAFNF